MKIEFCRADYVLTMKVADELEEKQTQLMPAPRPFDGYVELLTRVFIAISSGA